MKAYLLIILATIYINLEFVHMRFSDKKYRYEYNFYSYATKKVNNFLPDNFRITEITTTEFVWWYVRDVILYVKAIILSILPLLVIDNKYIKGIIMTLCFFVFKELIDYTLFKNLFTMYYDNIVANITVITLTLLYTLNDSK